ncbi:hypothetical protein [Hymenobacter guriensis]|uniref:Uncharacterized protein n=1 Tax=Hymenobacter guriensis TaxID=2793065 RepID=A0ABS0L7D8_9BACT|nr:hypothetical protein [Hymenobacter guriensis]MBG8556051.1 hypothetical protein [Hymenobacter guriensis]
MPSYEPSVITLPASETAHLIEKQLIHSRPAKKRLLSRDRYYCFRGDGNEMKRIYSIIHVLSGVDPILALQQLNQAVFPNSFGLTEDQATRLKNYLNGIEHGIRAKRIKISTYHEPQVFYFLATKEDDTLPPHTRPAKPTTGPINYTRDELKAGGILPAKS